MRRLEAFLAVAWLGWWSSAGAALPDRSNAEMFHDYAVASCLAQAFPAIAPDASGAASGYLQLGNAPAEAYMAATKLASEFVARDYPSFSGRNLGVMKCLDLGRSRELYALVAKYYPRRRR